MGKRHNRNRRACAPFVMLPFYLIDSAAYRSLNCASRGVLIEIARTFNGSNNGRLAMSVRTLAHRCHLAPATVTRALRELQDRQFIECVTPGSFDWKVRHASEWRLTWWNCDATGALPSKAFTNWGKQNPVLEYARTVPIRAHFTLEDSN
jgi:hypothetical protein